MLNENSVMMGLNYQDVVGLSLHLLAWQTLSLFLKIHLTYEALLATALLAIALIPIRLKYRRHILRDILHYYLTPRAIYVAKNYRSV